MRRIFQTLLIATFVPFCWLAMQAVHELGHVLAGSLSGGTVTKVVLHPLSISRTDVAPNPSPLLVVWAGPTIGVILPLLIWRVVRLCRIPLAYLSRFFAGFCLIANGAYIGLGSIEGIGDAGDMLRHGSPSWSLWLFGAVSIPIGFRMWHGLGVHFGLGAAKGQVDIRAVYASIFLFMLTVILTMCLSPKL
jgi:hypothetical protein